MPGETGDDATLEYVKAKFKQYYASKPLRLPPRFGRREFGFIFFNGGYVQRHLSFSSEAEVYRFVRSRLPAHLYHSAAYYETPGAPTMDQKGWMGADLIFDLDADHIPGWQRLGYKGMLEAVKAQVIHLIDEFLEGDLGFARDEMIIAFSGARGYHIHIRRPEIMGLESHERREIVDYVTATDLDLDAIVESEAFHTRTYAEKTTTLRRLRIPQSSDPGWKGRAASGVVEWLESVSRLPEKEALKAIRTLEGVGLVRAAEIYKALAEGSRRDQTLAKVRKGILDLFPSVSGPSVIAEGVKLAKGATDEPVTSDIKRLIRMVGSLHGKTGMMVVPLTRDQLDDFDPLVNAVPPLYSHDRIRIIAEKGIETDMMGETFNITPGQNSVPEYLAIFLMCRGMATLASGSPDEGKREGA